MEQYLFLNFDHGRFPMIFENEHFYIHGGCIIFSDTGADTQHTYHQRRLHTHPLYEAHIILKGGCVFELRNQEMLPVPAGSFVIFPPEEPHRILSESNSFSKLLLYYDFIPKNTETGRRYAAATTLLKPPAVWENPPDTSGLLAQILRLYREQNFDLDYPSNLTFLFMLLHGSLLNTVVKAHNAKILYRDSRVTAATTFIERNISTNLRVEQVAAFVDLSGKHLNRLFQRDLGMTAGAYIQAIIHKQACQLLLKPEFTPQMVMEALQYSDYFSFSRAFKRLEGVTPSQYRKRNSYGI